MSDSTLLSTRAIFIGNKLKPAEKNSNLLFVRMGQDIKKWKAVNLHRISHDNGAPLRVENTYVLLCYIWDYDLFYSPYIVVFSRRKSFTIVSLFLCFSRRATPTFTYKRRSFYFQGCAIWNRVELIWVRL